MIRSFLTITFRVLWRNKITSFANITSLSIGIFSFILIMLYIRHETSYDKFNRNYDRIYRLEGDNYGKLPPAIGIYLDERIAGIETIARLVGGSKDFISYVPDDDPQKLKHIEATYFWADSNAFDVFTLPFVQGDPRYALKEPFTVVLTARTAEKMFGASNAMKKNIRFSDHEFTVTGIIKDVKHSHLEIDALFSIESIPKVYPGKDLGWSPYLWSATYLLMTAEINKDAVEKKINDILATINNGILFDIEFETFHIRPLGDIYLSGSVQNLEYGSHGNLNLIQVLSAMALFLLLLACINYINLTTARSTTRAREITVKRIVGSPLIFLRFQLIVESVIVSLVALGVAFTLVQIFLPTFEVMAIKDFGDYDLKNPTVWVGIVFGVVLLGILAGIYPAIYLTAATPFSLLKGHPGKGSGRSLFRSLLMTFQFTISVIMIIGIIANLRQMHFVRNADLGFRKEQVVTVSTPGGFQEEFALRETLKERLLQHTQIINCTFSAGNPGGGPPTGTLEFEGVKRTIGFFFVDDQYLDVMEVKLIEGRTFSPSRPGERVDVANRTSKENDRVGVLLNETAVAEFGISSPIGKMFYWTERDGRRWEVEVIGVVSDFHFRSLHHKVEPLFIFWTDPMHLASIKIKSSDIPATLRSLEKEWKNVYGDKPFSYQFLDDVFDRQYRNEEQLAGVIACFTGLAVIIACLGLFALSSFMVSRRTKEIGVRKSLGATVKSIYLMLSWHFLKWIFLAVLIAIPVALYLIDLWLSEFAYHIPISADIFVIAALLSVVVALLTVTLQTLKAASANPVKALRYE